MPRFTVKAWSPDGPKKTQGHSRFNLNAPDIRTALNVARARVPRGEVNVTPYRKER